MVKDESQVDPQDLKKIMKSLQNVDKLNKIQVAISFLSLVPGFISIVYGGSVQITVASFITALVIIIVVLSPYMVDSTGKTNWREWIVARERLKVQADIASHIMSNDNPYMKLYCSVLRMQRDTALAEEKMELAATLSKTLDKCLEKNPNA